MPQLDLSEIINFWVVIIVRKREMGVNHAQQVAILGHNLQSSDDHSSGSLISATLYDSTINSV